MNFVPYIKLIDWRKVLFQIFKTIDNVYHCPLSNVYQQSLWQIRRRWLAEAVYKRSTQSKFFVYRTSHFELDE